MSSLSAPLISSADSSSSSPSSSSSSASLSSPPAPNAEASAAVVVLMRAFLVFVTVFSTIFTLFVMLIMWAFIQPLLQADAAYSPKVGPIAGNSTYSTYEVMDVGTATFSAFAYQDDHDLRNATTSLGRTAVTDDSYTSTSDFGLSCQYTVYTSVTSFSRQWIAGQWLFVPGSGEQATLTAPACSALNLFRAVLIVACPLVVPYTVAMVWFGFYLFKAHLDQQKALLSPPPQPGLSVITEVDVPAAGAGRSQLSPWQQRLALALGADPAVLAAHNAEAARTAQRRGQRPPQAWGPPAPPRTQAAWISALYTWSAVLGVIALMVMSAAILAMWTWIAAADLPNQSASSWAVALTAILAALWLLCFLDVYLRRRAATHELNALREKDDSIDATAFRWSAMLCCARAHRSADGNEPVERLG